MGGGRVVCMRVRRRVSLSGLIRGLHNRTFSNLVLTRTLDLDGFLFISSNQSDAATYCASV